MTIDQIAPEALRLPIQERALLAASLWESIDDPYAHVSDSDAILLAIERDREIDSGEVAPLSHDQLMDQLRQ